ncbi:HsdM family class I SAM-dependent methyltransferase [Aeromonas caviae]|uniref:HsdM family class I SAM-dependent methyltransferase n=1 Tax=Aeromonas caviae TaxID=648 RepID=UPI002B47686E|nr:Eco57I restriction-modification methylase domain-containing protein [Aeromonas caviae]
MVTIQNLISQPPEVDTSTDLLIRYHACKAMAKGYAEKNTSEQVRLEHARSFCALVVQSFWAALCNKYKSKLKIKPYKHGLLNLAVDVRVLAEEIGTLISIFPAEDSGYLIGSIYTAMLPSSLRSEMGAFYTPPPLVNRLLDQIEAAGFDYSIGSAIDPACGGGAFLAPLAMRMIRHEEGTSPELILRQLSKRLKGIELDPFAAWMSTVLLESAVLPICIAAKSRMADVIIVGDALQLNNIGLYDLVVGNPPYGRVKLDDQMRRKYSRSLYGHANLYGLFTDLALQLVNTSGILAYLTPTSFLGGQYYKALRKLLTDEMTPVSFDFIADRDGVFDDVLQETMLTTYIKSSSSRSAQVSVVIPQGLNEARVDHITSVRVNGQGDPWLLPRDPQNAIFLNNIINMPTRISALGYTVATGQLVWNRHKEQLTSVIENDSLPLIWAESVTINGFQFSANKRNHVPYINVKNNQAHLVTRNSVVLLQRTTSKEQNRRLLAAELPQKFIDEHGGAVIENHLNLVYSPSGIRPKVSLSTICLLLNTETVDRAFRCISGSVAVSAYEINALPLPSIEQLVELEEYIKNGASKISAEKRIASFYGVE